MVNHCSFGLILILVHLCFLVCITVYIKAEIKLVAKLQINSLHLSKVVLHSHSMTFSVAGFQKK